LLKNTGIYRTIKKYTIYRTGYTDLDSLKPTLQLQSRVMTKLHLRMQPHI